MLSCRRRPYAGGRHLLPSGANRNGRNQTELTVDVNAEHIGLINTSKEKYDIADEGKVVRIIMDYLITNPGIHDTVFKDVRCLRCE